VQVSIIAPGWGVSQLLGGQSATLIEKGNVALNNCRVILTLIIHWLRGQ